VRLIQKEILEMSADKEFYNKELIEGEIERAVNYITPYIDAWRPQARSHFSDSTPIRVLDLGAGSCTISLVLSKEPYVGSIVASDISALRMENIAPKTQAIVGGLLEKLSFQEIDFNVTLPFDDNSFDLVIMDAALHHSRNIWETLTEIRRVLKPKGMFVAQREAYVSPLTHWITFKRLLASPEVAAGVSENAFLISQYDYYFRVNGFIPAFHPVFERWIFKALFFLNGIAFSKYNIVSVSTKTV
jgi:ubiquinone/menaquinone biosynthesis C-methylase UbiE